MKNFLLILLFAATTFSVSAQKTEKTPYLTKSLSGESVKNVKVETSGGSISVTGVSASEARLEVYISGNNSKDELSKEEIESRLKELYTLDITVSGGRLEAKAKAKERNMNWKKSLSISFKVFVPKNVSTDLSTSGGSISLTNLSGNQEFSTSGGSLNVDKVEGKIDGATSGGSINLEDSKDDIELTTSGGSIHAKNCQGKIRLATSGGSLDLSELSGDIKATTSGGSVNGMNISGELEAFTSGGSIRLSDLSCSVSAATSGGNVDVSIKELGKYVKLGNSGGNITLRLPANKGLDLELSANRIKTDNLANFSGKVEEEYIQGKMNGGGVPVTVKAGSGSIYFGVR